MFLTLLDDAAFRSDTIPTLARYDEPEVGHVLIDRFATFSESDRAAALNTLTGRAAWAHALLDAVADGRIDKRNLSEYYVRQMVNLNSEAINKRLAQQWGKVARSSAEKLAHITNLESVYTQAPLWAYSAPEGKKHFQKLCVSCHSTANEATDIGPQLAGSGAKGIRYFVENIVDPNAVIGADYLTWVVLTKDGRVVSGLVQQSTDTAVTLQTPTEKVVIPRAEIESMKKTGQSLMPERMLETLNERQRIELLKYLGSI